ncbi:hypothetical protein CSB37_03585 [bacterium DOLZORAL124_38_8]|nr:MAG: hypothetical protein CSB37_03585 [bacterium DOLZORAL124_38_8]
MKKILKNTALKILLVTNSMVLISGAMIAPIYAIFVEKIGGDLLDASFASALFAVVAGITTFFSGRISNKMTEDKKVVSLGYLLIASAFFGYTQVESMTTLLFMQILLGIGESIYSPPFDAEFSRHLDKGESASEWGIWESTNYFSSAIGALFGGYIATTFGFNTLFIIMGILSLSSSVYLYFLPKKVL